MSEIAQLLVPRIEWSAASGHDAARPLIERSLALGVGGFLLGPAPLEAAKALATELHDRSTVPLLIAADLERGAGEAFAGATPLPPALALASLGDADVARRAGRITAHEACDIGVNWAFAPVCDLDVLATNPIVGTRAFSATPTTAAELVAEWIDACQACGVLACAKHFPGHGRTTLDSHLARPLVQASEDLIYGEDLVPFRAAIDAGVASMMTAHVGYAALDSSGEAATLSPAILRSLLRDRLDFDGLVVSDAIGMTAVRAERTEDAAIVAALAAGCDLILDPADVSAAARAIDAGLDAGTIGEDEVHQSLERRRRWAEWGTPRRDPPAVSDDDREWARTIAQRTVSIVRGMPRAIPHSVDVVVIDDDDIPGRDAAAFLAGLARHGHVPVRDGRSGASRGPLVVALLASVHAGKGRAALSADARAAANRACSTAVATDREAILVLFGHPRIAAEVPTASAVVCAWASDALMQNAAAQWLAARTTAAKSPGRIE